MSNACGSRRLSEFRCDPILLLLIPCLRSAATQHHRQEQKVQAHNEKRRAVEKKVGESEQVVSHRVVFRLTMIIGDGKLRARPAAEASIWDPHLLSGNSG